MVGAWHGASHAVGHATAHGLGRAPATAEAVAVLVALAALLAVGLWLRVRRRPRLRRRWRFLARPRYPVVLAHGLFGFDELGLGTLRQAYWKGIRAALEQDGCKVIVPV